MVSAAMSCVDLMSGSLHTMRREVKALLNAVEAYTREHGELPDVAMTRALVMETWARPDVPGQRKHRQRQACSDCGQDNVIGYFLGMRAYRYDSPKQYDFLVGSQALGDLIPSCVCSPNKSKSVIRLAQEKCIRERVGKAPPGGSL